MTGSRAALSLPMREQLDALVSELRRLRRDGVSRVVLSDESLDALKSLAATAKASSPESAAPAPAPAESVAAKAPARPVAAAQAAPTPAPERVAPVRETPPVKVFEETPPPPPAPKPVAHHHAPKAPAAPPMPVPPKLDLPAGDAPARLAALRERLLSDPAALSRVAPGKSLVAFDGAPDAPVLFLIHMPGADDGRDGRILAGAEGELYGKIVAAMGLPRAKVCTASLLPYRPEIPGGYDHREPLPDEVAYYLPFLRELIATVKPRVIVALGRGAQDALFGKSEVISKSRGRWREFEGIPVMPTYHISYLIRNNTNKSKRIVWEDMLAVMERLALPISEKQRGYFL